MEQQIMEIIENEVNRRVSERLSNVISHVAKTYRLPFDKLMKDVAGIEVKTDQCLGIVGKGTRCTRHARLDGYCKMHQDQKPRIVMCREPVEAAGPAHTHSLPPLFLAGCPACEKVKSVKSFPLF
jgi:Family of unknown function (DUF5763)